jgi:hypothetical protein
MQAFNWWDVGIPYEGHTFVLHGDFQKYFQTGIWTFTVAEVQNTIFKVRPSPITVADPKPVSLLEYDSPPHKRWDEIRIIDSSAVDHSSAPAFDHSSWAPVSTHLLNWRLLLDHRGMTFALYGVQREIGKPSFKDIQPPKTVSMLGVCAETKRMLTLTFAIPWYKEPMRSFSVASMWRTP